MPKSKKVEIMEESWQKEDSKDVLDWLKGMYVDEISQERCHRLIAAPPMHLGTARV